MAFTILLASEAHTQSIDKYSNQRGERIPQTIIDGLSSDTLKFLLEIPEVQLPDEFFSIAHRTPKYCRSSMPVKEVELETTMPILDPTGSVRYALIVKDLKEQFPAKE